MKFPHIIGRKEMIRAALSGSITGLVGVLVFMIILNSMNSTYTEEKQQNELIPVSSQQTEEKKENEYSEQFYAKQHGVFSTFEKASEFVYGHSSLNTSAVVEIDGNFYVWSGVATSKDDIVLTEDPPSFVKPFTLSAEGCKKPALKNLPSLLKNDDSLKLNFEGGKKMGDLPPDWESITFALSSISNDLSVVRMHLLAHYFTENDCLKIKF
ncbi:hypothetical protein NST62_08005 [Ureibacillus sp. FSL K6-8385]|uniref:Uncharacterized protein n=1 Tax=Ureibacillus terrenus TaxID=118246 RepID=A0A540V049_9BACL|nr:hypothetical protein [Ureibacillus terrenus]MED3660977.1 hypothetical protein [Ureibacillus terrenus]MED3763807.1 hypothetical protein [Ureibacillus terrenus]TQE90126.1 hypothetical protein FKZ59_11430 [Ureibacillus terrenus]